MTSVKAARPHYLPASLIGGFGEPDTGKHAGHLRYSWVCVRRAEDYGTVTRTRAGNIAIQNGVYDVAEPGPDLPADFAEQLWQQYEGSLPGAIRVSAPFRTPAPGWPAARFAVLRHRDPAQHFLANDKGYLALHDIARDVRGVVFPLSGLVAVLMVVEVAQQGDDYEQGLLVERSLNPKGMKIINEATWDTAGIKCVIGQPR